MRGSEFEKSSKKKKSLTTLSDSGMLLFSDGIDYTDIMQVFVYGVYSLRNSSKLSPNTFETCTTGADVVMEMEFSEINPFFQKSSQNSFDA